MRSPTLIMFVFAMICCFNICDGADEGAKKVILDLKDTVKKDIEIFQIFLNAGQTALNKELNTMLLNLTQTLDGIADSFNTEFEKNITKIAPSMKKNKCVLAAKKKLNRVTAPKKAKFTDFIKIIPNIMVIFDNRVINDATSLRRQCSDFLKHLRNARIVNENLMAFIEAKFVFFGKRVTNEKSIIESGMSIAYTSTNDRAKQLKDDVIIELIGINAEFEQCLR